MTEWLHFSIIFPDNIPGGSVGKEFTCNTGAPGLIPGSGRVPRGGNGHPLQYSCLGNPRQRSLAAYSPWCHKGSDTTEWLNHINHKVFLISLEVPWVMLLLLSCFSRVQLSDSMDCSLPGSSIHGTVQARVLEWGAIAFSIIGYISIENIKVKKLNRVLGINRCSTKFSGAHLEQETIKTLSCIFH